MNSSGIDANESAAHRSSGLPLKNLQRYAIAILSVGVALGMSLLLEHFQFRVPSALLLLFAVAISSWFGGPGPAVLGGILSTASFYWYFVEPVRTIYIYPSEIPYFIVFAAFALLISWFAAVRRKNEADLREQADLLNLTHDTVFAMDMEGVIRYWNRGAEERYGWTAEQAVGRVVHDLLKTVFPAPLEEIKAEVIRTGRWEGELVHTKQDSSQVVVASRWALQRDLKGAPIAILETNNDITERKQAEEALCRSNRELRALSDCNQALLRATDEQSLLKEICRIVCEEAGYRMAWVGFAEHDEARSVRPVAWSGAEEGYLATASITWADTERGRGPAGTAIRGGKSCYIQDYATDPRFAPWRESASSRGFRSGIVLPLKDERATAFGCLCIYSAQSNAFTPEEIRLLEELAADLAFGIVTLRSRAARKQAEQEVALLGFAVNNVREAAFLIDDEGCFHYVNEEACRGLGYTRAELLGMAVPDIDPGVPAGSWPEHWRERQSHGSLSFESRHRTRDGRIFPVEISASYFEYGGRAYTLALARDISERKRAEQKLKESEERLRLTLEAARIGVFDWDLKTDQWYASSTYYAALGHEARPGPGDWNTWAEDFHPEDRARVVQLIEDTRAGRRGEYEYEARIRHVDGSYRWIHVVTFGIERDSDGNVTRILGLRMNITARKRAEEILRESEQRYRALFEKANDAIFLENERDEIIEVNQRACALLGYSREELLTMKVSDLQAPEVRGQVGGVIRSEIEKHGGATFEGVDLHRSGRRIPVEVTNTPISDQGQELILSIVRDISERKRAEEALRRTENELRNVIDTIPAYVFSAAPDSTVAFRNSPWREYSGLTFEPSASSWQSVVYPEDLPRHRDKWEESFATGRPLNSEARWRRAADGEYRWLWARAVPLRDEQGNILKWYGVLTDIEDRKRAEEALKRSEAYLTEAQRLSHTGSWAWDVATGKYVYWSEELFRIFGFDPQERIGTLEEVSRRFHPEDRNRWKENFEKSLREKVDTFNECRFVMPDGTVKHLHLVRHPVLNAAGEVVQLVGTALDITEHKRAAEAQRRSEAYLAEAERLSHTGSWAFDLASNKYIYVSEECLRIFGLNAEEDLPTREAVSRLIHREDWDTVKEAFEKSVREKVDTTSEFRIALASGTTKHIQATRHPVLNGAGEVVQLVGTAIDITERKRAEEALRRSEAYLAEGQRLTHTGSWALDTATDKYIYWSEEMFRIYGFDPKEGLPTRQAVFQRALPVDLNGLERSFQQSLREKVDNSQEYRFALPDGTVKHVYITRHLVLNEAGEFATMVGTSVDITERKRAEQELREGERRFRTFVDHAGDAFFVYDLEQRVVVDVNREACESLGYAREELVGKSPRAFHLDSYEAELESITERAAAGQTVIDRHRHLRKDGTMFPVEVHTGLVSYAGRRFLLMVARDISERLQVEEQRERLRQLEADLAHIDRVNILGELAASIAHEVNQPLSGIVSSGGACLRWLAADPPNLAEVREAVRRIIGAGKHAGEVIARIRALTKRTAAPKEKLDLNETIREVLVLVGDEAKRNKVIIRTPFADDLSPVLGDRVQFQQVVLNLVINGIEAMSSVSERARELVITTRNIDPEQVQVTVEDSGTGIDPNTISKVFDPFYTTKPGGMGMGLSISRSILQHHGGRLWATAKDGPGTSFHFTLPKYHEEASNAGV
jgi:PAS domain S-box-containing protein